MKLLFDQNLSPRLVGLLADLYPESKHVSVVDLDKADDLVVWQFAGDHGFMIVSKDADFNEISLQRGFPPEVIWIRRGNCSTKDLAQILRQQFQRIQQLKESKTAGILLLY